MTAKYQKRASRDVRPFFGAVALENLLDGAEIRLFDDQPQTTATSFTIEEQDVPRLDITVYPRIDVSSLVGAPIPRQSLALVVTVVNPFLKRTRQLLNASLGKTPPPDVSLGAETLEQLGGGSNITIDVALCLSKELPKRPGSPFLVGHWLSKKSFTLRSPQYVEDFDIEPTDDEGWKALGLPPKTLYLVDYIGSINEPATRDHPIAKIRLHSDVFKKLSDESNQKMARPLMSMLAAEIPCQILAASAADWDSSDQVQPRSPLSAFLKRINKVQACSLDELRRMVKEPGMSRLRAILHADQHSVRQVAEA